MRDFPGDPVAKTLLSQCRGVLRSIPGQGSKSPMLQLKIFHAIIKAWHSQKKRINKGAADGTSLSPWAPVSFQDTLQANNPNLVTFHPTENTKGRSRVAAVNLGSPRPCHRALLKAQ